MNHQRRKRKRAVVVVVPKGSNSSQLWNTILGAGIGAVGSIAVALLTQWLSQSSEARGETRIIVQTVPVTIPAPLSTPSVEPAQTKSPTAQQEPHQIQPRLENTDPIPVPKESTQAKDQPLPPPMIEKNEDNAPIEKQPEPVRPPLPPSKPEKIEDPIPVPSPQPIPVPIPPEPPATPAVPADIEVETVARLESIRIPNVCTLRVLAEDIEVTIAGRRVRLSLNRNGAWETNESLELPPGEHRYTLTCSARVLYYPGEGAFPIPRFITGTGKGKIVVKEGTRLLVQRDACRGWHYTACLRANK
jgi:hypothetical protein